ncbi:hypothetical protein BV20DRAFT_533105 [Pilatotrama ljubarskyi]|nr:hypothetical protein BV20DRAFT_533105 [Pilatotrama ljubarskyi]
MLAIPDSLRRWALHGTACTDNASTSRTPDGTTDVAPRSSVVGPRDSVAPASDAHAMLLHACRRRARSRRLTLPPHPSQSSSSLLTLARRPAHLVRAQRDLEGNGATGWARRCGTRSALRPSSSGRARDVPPWPGAPRRSCTKLSFASWSASGRSWGGAHVEYQRRCGGRREANERLGGLSGRVTSTSTSKVQWAASRRASTPKHDRDLRPQA